MPAQELALFIRGVTVNSIKKGKVVSQGYGIGMVKKIEPYQPNITQSIEPNEVTSMIMKYEAAIEKSKIEIEQISQIIAKDDPNKGAIFEAHLEILTDVSIDEMVKEAITALTHPSKAIQDGFQVFIEMLSQVDDPLIKERVVDLKDVSLRILRNLEGKPSNDLTVLSHDTILIAKDLLPSETATMDKRHVKGIITEIGSETSHSAIIARSYDIPALLGVKDALSDPSIEGTLILDAIEGKIITAPDLMTIHSYQLKAKAYKQHLEENKANLPLEAVTLDNHRVELHLNIESNHDEALKLIDYVDGVGLFRSEFLYMKNTHLPTFEEQTNAYSEVCSILKSKKVILRTLDIGGDKTLPYYPLPVEENPFLGKRALRLCLEDLDLFKTQIKAALVASKGNLELMFPMVGSIDDIIKAKEVVELCKEELRNENKTFDENLKVGIMIEIPSIALMADEVAKMVDFASIGTNDLTQYLMAVDRMDASLSEYYQSYSPALFRVLKVISDSFINYNKPLSVCGELGGDPNAVGILIGLGINKLSMSASQVAIVKKMIRSHTYQEFKELALNVLNSTTQQEVKNLIEHLNKKD